MERRLTSRALAWWLATTLAAAVAIVLAACGGTTTSSTSSSARAVACPQAQNDHGYPGACAPRKVGGPLATVPAGVRFLDLSNNDPCGSCAALIRQYGAAGLIVKANQGRWRDPTGAAMIAQARAAGFAVGVYDFDQDYTVAEAQVLVAQAQAAGLTPKGRNEFPLTLDVEYGSYSTAGLQAQIAYLHSLGWRVDVYTGEWYWGPHAGCWWPSGIPAWISGYPNAVAVCGLPASLFVAHQWTSSPFDQSVYLHSDWQAFVDTAPVGPSAATVARWRRALAASSRALARDEQGARVQRQRAAYFTARLKTA